MYDVLYKEMDCQNIKIWKKFKQILQSAGNNQGLMQYNCNKMTRQNYGYSNNNNNKKALITKGWEPKGMGSREQRDLEK